MSAAPRDAPPASSPAAGGAAPFTGEIHPFADAFPMLDDESLRALADDITGNGQRHPILLDADGVLIDGRNRLAACEIAGVDPVFAVFDGDPIAVIVSENMQRRDLTQGQKAHLAVSADGYGLTNIREQAAVAGISHGLIAQARTIAKFAPHLVPEVIAGQLGHSKAYEIAKAAKDEAQVRDSRWREMQDCAADLLARIDDDFTFDMAYAAYRERDKERLAREKERHAALQRDADRLRNFMDGWYAAATLANAPDRDDILATLSDYDRDRFLRMEKNTTWRSTTI